MSLFMFLYILLMSTVVAAVVEPAGTGSSCEILEEKVTETDGKLIRVSCHGTTVEVELEEGGSYSKTRITSHSQDHITSQEALREFLTVEYFKGSNDMIISMDGEQFDVKDGDSEANEAAKLQALLGDPEFEFFPEAVRLIHDELKLTAWQSPAVMFLYMMGIAAEKYHITSGKKGAMLRRNKRTPIGGLLLSLIGSDSDIYDYNGPTPEKECKYNGWAESSLANLTDSDCLGICGPGCSCWEWMCGDCCLHAGCSRHDVFCSSYFNLNCLTARGILWDLTTDSPWDC